MRGMKIIIPVAVTGLTLWARAGQGGFQNITTEADTQDVVVSIGLGVITSMVLNRIL
tara:strand:+ start:287 stop:457 length:171 start_codon:yes stop_codon:yes gene_type:complete